MIQSNETAPEIALEEKLPRRDWLLLPTLSLITICLLASCTESIGRRMFPPSEGNIGRDCLIDDPSKGVRGVPNCVGWEKNPETPLIEYRFDGCGYRTGMDCGHKQPRVYRIVMTGSSIPMGYGVSREQSFAAILPAEISQQTGRKVEVYNESLVRNSANRVSLGFDQLLAAKPDLILWILSPLDVNGEPPPVPRQRVGNAVGNGASEHYNPETLLTRVQDRMKEAVAKGSVSELLLDVWNQHSSSVLIEHYLYESQSLYLKSSLGQGDDGNGYLKDEPSEKWRSLLRAFDGYAADIEARANAAGVPLVAVLLPLRAQAAMISVGSWPAGYDPYKLDGDVRSIITSHGGTYIDVMPTFRTIANPEQYYFPIDGHPDGQRHAIISGLLASALTDGAIPGLSAAAGPHAAAEKEHGR